jgi:hypothetical protein
LIWARYGLQLLDERRAKLQPFTDNWFNSTSKIRRTKKSNHRKNGWLIDFGERHADDDDLPF